MQYHHVKIPGINLFRRTMYGSHNKKKGKHMIEKLATELMCKLLNQQNASELDIDKFDGDPMEFYDFS